MRQRREMVFPPGISEISLVRFRVQRLPASGDWLQVASRHPVTTCAPAPNAIRLLQCERRRRYAIQIKVLLLVRACDRISEMCFRD